MTGENVEIEVEMTDEEIAFVVENSPLELDIGGIPVILTAVEEDEVLIIDVKLKKEEG